MTILKTPFRGVLATPIHLADAKPTGLRRALAVPPDETDELKYISDALSIRYDALDKFFELTANAPDIWEQRGKALISREANLEMDSPDWWRKITSVFAQRMVPGFSLKLANESRPGAPVEWTLQQLSQLFADVEFLKKNGEGSVRKICQLLGKKPKYRKRWGRYSPASLRKAYTKANNLRSDFAFQMVLCHPASVGLGKHPNQISDAIERHALKP